MKKRFLIPLIVVLILLGLFITFWQNADQAIRSDDDQMAQNDLVKNVGNKMSTSIVFEPSVTEATLARDYDQAIKLRIRNTKDAPIRIAAKSTTKFSDFLAEVTGPGSVDEPISLDPGETFDLNLAVFSPDANQSLYEVSVSAGDAIGTAKINIQQPDFDLSFNVVDENQQTLAKTIEIRNNGGALGDFSVNIATPHQLDARLEPTVRHANFPAGGAIKVRVAPVLFLEFEKLKLNLECKAAGKTAQTTIDFQVPKNMQLFGIRSGTKKESESEDWYCTNKPNTCSELPGAQANGSLTQELIDTLEMVTAGGCEICPKPECKKYGAPCETLKNARKELAWAKTMKGIYLKLIKEASEGEHESTDFQEFQDEAKRRAEKASKNQSTSNRRSQSGGGAHVGARTEVVVYKRGEITEAEIAGWSTENTESQNGLYPPLQMQWMSDASVAEFEETGYDPRRDSSVGVRVVGVVEDPTTLEEEIIKRHEEAHKQSMIETFDEFKNGNMTWEEWYSFAHPDESTQGYRLIPNLMEEVDRYDGDIKWLTEFIANCSSCCDGEGMEFPPIPPIRQNEKAGLGSKSNQRMAQTNPSALQRSRLARNHVGRRDFETFEIPEAVTQHVSDGPKNNAMPIHPSPYTNQDYDGSGVGDIQNRSAKPNPPKNIFKTISAQTVSLQDNDRKQSTLQAAQPLAPIPELRLRPGLLEAMSYRGSFSRNHRGPYSSPMRGKTDDQSLHSSDYAASFHAGDRVYFAWHDQNQIIFSEFTANGEQVGEPMILGNGSWPKITAHDDRVTVGWNTDNGFLIRTRSETQIDAHENRWNDGEKLTGTQAVIGYSPNGQLFAVTSNGLWKQSPDGFKNIRTTSLNQPSLSFDSKGAPHIAHVKEGKIWLDGEEVATGEHPTTLFGSTGKLFLAFLFEGKLQMKVWKENKWTKPTTLSTNKPSWPVLSHATDGPRLSFHGAAAKGPNALWLIRNLNEIEFEKNRNAEVTATLMPSLAGNVSNVSLLLELALNQSRSRYRAHDTIIRFNDIEVGRLMNTVPEGRYLFELNPLQVFFSPGKPVFNRVSIHTRHMNGGHYLVSSGYRLITTTEWSEYFAYGKTIDEIHEADRNRPNVNHDQVDLAILANNLDLPVSPPTGHVDFPVIVANMGEATSQPSKLVLQSGKHYSIAADIPELEPDEQFTTTFRLFGGPRSAVFEIMQPEPDYKPENDRLRLTLWEGGASETPNVTLIPSVNDEKPFWIANDFPRGAKVQGNWVWTKTAFFQNAMFHSTGITEGRSLHSFHDAIDGLNLGEGENLIQYVYLDSNRSPTDLLLRLGKRSPPMYWGETPWDIPLGRDRIHIGDLPPTGKWIRLKIPFKKLGISPKEITGMTFGHLDGNVHWGPTTKSKERLDSNPEMMIMDR